MASMLNDTMGCMAFGAKSGVNSMYKMEETVNMGEKRRKLIEGGVERLGPLRCQFTTAIILSEPRCTCIRDANREKLTIRCQGYASSSHEGLEGPKADDESSRHGEDRYAKKTTQRVAEQDVPRRSWRGNPLLALSLRSIRMRLRMRRWACLRHIELLTAGR